MSPHCRTSRVYTVTAVLILPILLGTGFLLAQNSRGVQVLCKVLNCINPIDGNRKICDVSNIELIHIKIRVKGISIAQGETTSDIINPINSSLANYYVVKVVQQSNGREIPIQCTSRGGGIELGDAIEEVSFQIPKSDVERKNKIRAWWEKSKAYANISHAQRASSQFSEEAFLNSVNHDMIDNQLGQYSIVCTFVVNQRGESVRYDSEPVNINVVNKGEALDIKPITP